MQYSVVTGSNAKVAPDNMGHRVSWCHEWSGDHSKDSVNPRNFWIIQKGERGALRVDIKVYAYQKDKIQASSDSTQK